MGFVLAIDRLELLDTLRSGYESKKGVNLDVLPGWLSLPKALGGVDILNRGRQIRFLLKIKMIFDSKIKTMSAMTTIAEWESNLHASRVMIAACLYVQSQIPTPKSDSVLYNLINSILGVSGTNRLNEEDIQQCYLTASIELTSVAGKLSEINGLLAKNKDKALKRFTDREWLAFSTFVTENMNKSTQEKAKSLANRPVASALRSVLGYAGASTGTTLGYLGGSIIGDSTELMPTKFKATTAIGGALLYFSPRGKMAPALFAQLIATKLLTTFCSVTLAQVMGIVMGILGQGAGVLIGIPIDTAYSLLWSTCSAIHEYYQSPNTTNGIRISDGASMFNGIPIILNEENEQLVAEVQGKTIELKDGNLCIDNSIVIELDSKSALPDAVIAELKKQLLNTQSKEVVKSKLPKQISVLDEPEETPVNKETDEQRNEGERAEGETEEEARSSACTM